MNTGTVFQPWDMAGADGLVAARALFGEKVDHLAPFQSMETLLEGEVCSVLRLCDRNFRITYPGPLDQIVAALQLQLWIKQLAWLSAMVLQAPSTPATAASEDAIALPIKGLPALMAQATVKAPHRLHPLPLHCAVPAHIATLPTLIWHHPIDGHPALELHLAQAHTQKMWSLIQSFSDGSVSLTTAST
ncbi:MAG TPA: hypothetical protein VEZ50_11740 [Nodosilinea sp.]|nr:hypothetical protein [Nodosilinea sp.]